MSAVRTTLAGQRALRVTDDGGGYVEVTAWRSEVPVVLTSISGGSIVHVAITLDDGLALLSFLADALGVERFVPGDGATALAEQCAWCGESRSAHPIESGYVKCAEWLDGATGGGDET